MLKIILDSSEKDFNVFVFDESWKYQTCFKKEINGLHSEYDVDLLFSFLNKNKIYPKDVSHFIINKGPGSFNGLRIAATIAKMFIFANKELAIFSIDKKHIETAIKNQLLSENYLEKGINLKYNG